MDYSAIIGIALQLTQTLIGTLTHAKAPAEVINAAIAANAALQAHMDDIVNKANLEVQRG